VNYPLIGIFPGVIAKDVEGFGLLALTLKLSSISMELKRVGFG